VPESRPESEPHAGRETWGDAGRNRLAGGATNGRRSGETATHPALASGFAELLVYRLELRIQERILKSQVVEHVTEKILLCFYFGFLAASCRS